VVVQLFLPSGQVFFPLDPRAKKYLLALFLKSSQVFLIFYSTYSEMTNWHSLWSNIRSWGSSVSTVSDYRLDNGIRSPAEAKDFFSQASVFRPALRPTQPPIPSMPEVKRGRGVMLTTYPHLVPRSRMSRGYSSSPPSRLHGGSVTSFYGQIHFLLKCAQITVDLHILKLLFEHSLSQFLPGRVYILRYGFKISNMYGSRT
jgi:hypothetical protein